MLEIILLYVGGVLLIDGVGALGMADYYLVTTGFLFTFTYLYIAQFAVGLIWTCARLAGFAYVSRSPHSRVPGWTLVAPMPASAISG